MKIEFSEAFLSSTACRHSGCSKRPWGRGRCFAHRLEGFTDQRAVQEQYLNGVLPEDIARWLGITTADVKRMVESTKRRTAQWSVALAPTEKCPKNL